MNRNYLSDRVVCLHRENANLYFMYCLINHDARRFKITYFDFIIYTLYRWRWNLNNVCSNNLDLNNSKL